jgi:hypothetical protein
LWEKVRRAGWAKEDKSTEPSGSHQGEYYTALLDGSDYLHSTTSEWPGCLQRPDAKGEGHCRHTVVAATLVKAGSHRVLPLAGEEVRTSEGQDKQDCAGNAAQRLLPRLRQAHPPRPLIVGGDDFYGYEPCIAQ